jgi:lysozyme
MMKTSQRGINLIKQSEGFRDRMYIDASGLPTIGYGTLIDSAKEEYLKTAIITEADGEALLKIDLINIEKGINNLVKPYINQNQFDALASFCYNLGVGNLKKSTLLKKINTNPADPNIMSEFMKWNRAKGKVLSGLTYRREAETRLYFS